MPPLYPKMRERPMEFRINYDAPLAEGLVFAGLGGHGCVGSMVYPDSSLYGNHGTLTNMDAATSWIWIHKLKRWGLTFDGVDDYVQLSRSHTISVSVPFSLAAHVLDNYTYDNVGAGIISSFAGGQANTWGVRSGSGALYLGNSNFQVGLWLPYQTPMHIASIYDSGTHFGYLNGYYAGQVAQGITSARLERIGHKNASWAQMWYGYICDLCVFARRLTSNEIAALADPSNVDLRVGGVPLILPPRRRFFPSVEIHAPTFNPAWAQHVNTYIGLGR